MVAGIISKAPALLVLTFANWRRFGCFVDLPQARSLVGKES
jgi:hypothetical protein